MTLKNADLLDFANSFADESRKILRKNYFKKFNIEKKKDGSLVTDVDKEIEILFRKKLKKKYRDHGVIGEEFESEKVGEELVWVIDPLDGTHSFIAGKPMFGTLICCLRNKVPIIGIIDIPILNQRWYGGNGLGGKLNGKNCKLARGGKKFNELIISSTSLLMFDESHQRKIKQIYKKVGFPVFGTDCYAYGLLLSGKIDLILEGNMKPWDYLAQVALITELGGCISDWNGEKLNIRSEGKVVASIDGNHHKNILKLLNGIN